MIGIIRLLKGYVTFEVWGGFPERFLNLCRIRGVNLQSLEIEGDRIRAVTDVRGFSCIDEILGRSGMNVKVTSERGLPFFLKRHKWRCGVVVGIAMVIFFIAYMSGFIWQVEIVGDDEERNLRIEESLREFGVYDGARKSKIKILDVQEKILLVHDDINWISLNIFGTKAVVEYTPVKEKQPLTDTASPVNVVAEKRGRVTLVECYSGAKIIKEGDYVSAGDLLISGVVVNGDGSEKITHASGKVFAQTENEYEYSCYLECERYIVESSDVFYSLNLFGGEIPLGRNREDNSSVVYINISGNDTELPVGLVRRDGFSCESRKIKLTEHQAKLMCINDAVTEKRREYIEADVKEIIFSQDEAQGVFILGQRIVCVENIAKEEKFYVEKN